MKITPDHTIKNGSEKIRKEQIINIIIMWMYLKAVLLDEEKIWSKILNTTKFHFYVNAFDD